MRKHSISIIIVIILYVCLCPIASAVMYNAYINTNTIVYSWPVPPAATVAVPAGLGVQVSAYYQGWCRIHKGKYTAYIPAGYLTPASAAKIDKVLLTAMDQVGKRYGRNPPKAFDCSSLVQYSFKKAGYSVKGTANAIANDNTYPKITSAGSVVKGDILCFDANSDFICDHVGLYLGAGYMIEASFNAGMVRVKKLDSWYASHFMFARRVS